jgi:ATPase subunit of ABC transporter with duplicated ATPase domains
MLTVSQLSKSFAGRALFDNVSLQVNRGDRIGLAAKAKYELKRKK